MFSGIQVADDWRETADATIEKFYQSISDSVPALIVESNSYFHLFISKLPKKELFERLDSIYYMKLANRHNIIVRVGCGPDKLMMLNPELFSLFEEDKIKDEFRNLFDTKKSEIFISLDFLRYLQSESEYKIYGAFRLETDKNLSKAKPDCNYKYYENKNNYSISQGYPNKEKCFTILSIFELKSFKR